MIDTICAIAEDLELSPDGDLNHLIDILTKVSHDNGLKFDKGEIPDLFCSMVLYSATSIWMKSAIFDERLSKSESNYNHIINVGNRFLNNFLEHRPKLSIWFDGGKHTSAYVIMEHLLKTGELCIAYSDMGVQSVFIGESKPIVLSDSLARYPGLINNEIYHSVSSLSFVNSRDLSAIDPLLIKNKKWVENYLEESAVSGEPHTIESKEGLEYFSKFGRYVTNESTIDKENAPFQLIRRNTIKGFDNFLKYGGKFYKIPAHIAKFELSRFKLYLYDGYGKAVIRQYGDGDNAYLTLKVPLRLPSHEEALLRSVMWPLKSLNDSFSFIGPAYLLNYIKNILDCIDLGVKYDSI